MNLLDQLSQRNIFIPDDVRREAIKIKEEMYIYTEHIQEPENLNDEYLVQYFDNPDHKEIKEMAVPVAYTELWSNRQQTGTPEHLRVIFDPDIDMEACLEAYLWDLNNNMDYLLREGVRGFALNY